MDENVVFPPAQSTQNPQQPSASGDVVGGAPQGPVQNMPSSIPASSGPVLSQPMEPVGSTIEPNTSPDAPRITLSDLYGPSGQQESTVVQQPVQESQPVVPGTNQPMEKSLAEVAPTAPEVSQVPSQPQAAPFEAFQKTPTAPVAIPHAEENVGRDEPSSPRFMPIIKFIVGGVLVAILLFLLWTAGSFLFSKKGADNGKVTITYWGLWEDANVMQGILTDFQKQHPNVTVVYAKQDPKDYTKRLLTRTQEGNGPDIFRLHNTWVYPLQDLLLPLPSSVIDQKQLSTQYPPVVTNDMVKNGAVFGLPLQMDTLSLFVNTDIFSHAGATVPTTWENFITVARALTVKDSSGHIKTSGAAIGSYENIDHSADIVSLLLLQNGANLQKLVGSANASDTLTFYTSFAKPDNSVWDSTLDNSLLAFERGNVAMYFGYSYDIFAILAANPSLHFSVHPVPHLVGRDMTVASYWVEGVSNKSKHQKEALELMQYLAQKDTQTRLYSEESKTRLFGELYPRLDLAEGLKGNATLAPFVNQYKTAQSSFFAGDTQYDEYNGALNRYLGNAINSMLKDTSADSAVATLSQGVAQVLSRYAPKTQ